VATFDRKIEGKAKERKKNKMKKSISKIILVVVCTVFVGLLALYGYKPMNITGIMDGGIKRGLDLVGGSSIVYAVKNDGTETVTYSEEDMEQVITMLRDRVDQRGYTEAVVARYGEDKILVEIPDVKDPYEAMQKIGTTANLTFVDSEGTVIVEGSNVKSAEAVYGDSTGSGVNGWFISLEFDESARSAFAEGTERVSALPAGSNYISIMLDTDVISSPTVSEKIDSSSCVINGSFTEAEAKELASLISAGRLPFELESEQLSFVGPTLGSNALENSLIAAAIGIVLVMLFMIIIYKIPGIVSSIALISYVALICYVLVLTGVNLTLPGIAGIILTIGMAVDANVVIYERIREELLLGKSVKSAVKSGFSRAIWAVIDSNVTTLIAAIVLYYFGTGTVKGFGITLGIGVVVSMFTAVLLSRFLLSAFVNAGVTNPALFGANRKKDVQNSKGGDN